jgi:hypothetical protein
MNRSEKTKAEKKADLALCKLQDIFYLNVTESVARKLNDACEKVRDLISGIENTEV